MSIHRKRNSWGKFPSTSPRSPRRRRGLWSRIHFKTQKTRTRVSVSSEMERIPHYWCNVGIGISVLWWRRYAKNLQRSTSTLTENLKPLVKTGKSCPIPIHINYFHLKRTKNGSTKTGKVSFRGSEVYKTNVSTSSLPMPLLISNMTMNWIGDWTTVFD